MQFMDVFFENLIVRAATIDELLSDDFEPLPGQKSDTDRAAQRLAAWCRSCASGDWSLFARRLERDGLTLADVLARLATVRRRAAAAAPAWIEDAIWIHATLSGTSQQTKTPWPEGLDPCPFESLFAVLAEQAEARLWSNIDAQVSGHLNAGARAAMRHALVEGLTRLCAPALYERFAKLRGEAANQGPTDEAQADANPLLDRFVAGAQAGGMRQLFDEKPVLLRLVAVITRQWIDTSREFVLRLAADLDAIRADIVCANAPSRVAMIEGGLSDPHNGGHSVQVVRFEDGRRVVYKPKDLRLDAGWRALVERLNKSGAPIELRAVRALSRDGYGWTEFIDHADYTEPDGAKRFFQRAGAWLALFHCFAGSDMHQENMLATGEHPVPIDLEMILQAAPDEQKSSEPESQAFEAAIETVLNSVMTVGLLPAYGKSAENEVFAIGGMTSDWSAKSTLSWNDINTDKMRPVKNKRAAAAVPNLPHSGGRQAKLGDHIVDFIDGFEDYATYLMGISRDADQGGLFEGFAGLPIRKVVRPTRFYYMLLQRLRNHRTMDDGALWSAQADFLARLSNWQSEGDILWPLQRGERAALVALNVPYFVSPSDGEMIVDATTGAMARTTAEPGLQRARARLRAFDAKDVAWQVAVIRQSTVNLSRSDGPQLTKETHPKLLRPEADATPRGEFFVAEAGRIAEELGRAAVRRGPGAAWIGLQWLGDSEVSQLMTLGADLYNGTSGIGLFLAAHAAVAKRESSRELALAAVSQLRVALHGRNAARLARSLGVGGALGLGSIVYALAAMAKCLGDDRLMADAHAAAALFTDDLIAADKQLDVLGGSAGAILGLLRLYRDSQSRDVLARATRCGEHLLAQSRHGTPGARSWIGLGTSARPLNGMSHGAAGFAYALASLSAATGREDFAAAAAECIAFEDASYDAKRANWPYVRAEEEPAFSCRWCSGAPGIGLSRLAMRKRVRLADPKSGLSAELLLTDIRNALTGVEYGWPERVDTMCCGTLGSVEFFCEAGDALARSDLRETAARRLMAVIESAAATGDYRWNIGKRQFNLGLFRGLAGVGYTCLRQADRSLPNVLIWE
jgi:type 2 lantibiotic biosynthesis protein LanM